MANLLESPELWTSQRDGSSPPSEWNGTSFYFDGIINNLIGLTNGMGSGDYVSGNIEVTTYPIESIGMDCQVFWSTDKRQTELFTVKSGETRSEDVWVSEVSSYGAFFIQGGYGRAVITPPSLIISGERLVKSFVSSCQRDRVFSKSLCANERRLFVTDFNGAIFKGQKIVSAVWQTHEPHVCVMSAPVVREREVQITIAAQYAGIARIRVDAILKNGDVYSAWHEIHVQPAPMFSDSGWVTGPTRLEASAL